MLAYMSITTRVLDRDNEIVTNDLRRMQPNAVLLIPTTRYDMQYAFSFASMPEYPVASSPFFIRYLEC